MFTVRAGYQTICVVCVHSSNVCSIIILKSYVCVHMHRKKISEGCIPNWQWLALGGDYGWFLFSSTFLYFFFPQWAYIMFVIRKKRLKCIFLNAKIFKSPSNCDLKVFLRWCEKMLDLLGYFGKILAFLLFGSFVLTLGGPSITI